MFKIDKSLLITIDRGDDSGRFPLFINMGTNKNPIRYELNSHLTILTDLDVEVDEFQWRQYVKQDDTYSFMYKDGQWYLFERLVSLEDYGITVKDVPKNLQTICIIYDNSEWEVYFYIIMPANSHYDNNQYLVKKTFRKDGGILTEYAFKKPRMVEDLNMVNELGDLMMRIESEDTQDLQGGDYLYIIKAKLMNKDTKEYNLNTITGLNPFVVVDNNYGRFN